MASVVMASFFFSFSFSRKETNNAEECLIKKKIWFELLLNIFPETFKLMNTLPTLLFIDAASVERFQAYNKTRLRNHLTDVPPAQLIRIATERPDIPSVNLSNTGITRSFPSSAH